MTITSGQGTHVITVAVGSSYIGGNVAVTASNACGASPERTRSTALNIPQTPGTITGASTNVCGLAASVYSVTAISGVTSYAWTVPAGAIINGSATGSSISVTYPSSAFTGGNVTIASVNSCGQSLARSLAVKAAPAQPSVIAGSITPCQNTTIPYSVTPVSGLTYNWSVTPGGVIASGQGSKTASVAWGTVVSTGQTLRVNATNGCGTSTNRTLAITILSCIREDLNAYANYVNAFPNPANDNVNIEFNSNDNSEYTVNLIDMSGRIVRSQSGVSTEGLNQLRFDVADLTSGIYMIILNNGSSQRTIRLMID